MKQIGKWGFGERMTWEFEFGRAGWCGGREPVAGLNFKQDGVWLAWSFAASETGTQRICLPSTAC